MFAFLRASLLLCACLAPGVVRAQKLQPPRFTRDEMEAALADGAAFRFVYGTRDPAATVLLRERALSLARRAFGGDSTQVVADRDVDETAFAAGPVFLLGGVRENAWTERIAAALPLQFERTGFRWQGKLYDQPLDAIQLAWPNPLAPKRFLLVLAGNSPSALARRGGFLWGEEDWRIVRAGEVLRSGSFAHDGGRPWHYEPARDRDREAERSRWSQQARTSDGVAVRLRAAPGVPARAEALALADAVLSRMTQAGLRAARGAPKPLLTLYGSLEEKGALTRDTHSEHLSPTALGTAAGAAATIHAARPAGRRSLDLWSVAATRVQESGGNPDSRFFVPAAVQWAGRFEGELLDRSVARLFMGGVLPSAREAATRDAYWRSPLVWIPSRALLATAVWQLAPAPARRNAWLALVRRDPPGTLDSLCRLAGVNARDIEQRYRLLAEQALQRSRAELLARRQVTWRPANGFQRGVCVAHAIGLERGYLSAECQRQLGRIREAGADGISLTPFAWLGDPAVPVLGNSTDSGPDGESDESLCEAAARARALGLRVWLKPHVWTRGWSGELSFTPSNWQRFFDRYEELALHWAILADREQLDGYFVGHELASSTAIDPARWRVIFAHVRKLYGGVLSYGANWDEAARVPFWDQLDVIGVSFYAPLADAPTRDPAVLRAGAVKALSQLQALSRRFGRPVILAELGYAPTPAAAVRPWEGGRGGNDAETQRACYEATISAMEPCDWLAGAYFWKWGSSSRLGDDPFDPRGKPAEAVILRALHAWQGRPVRVPAATGK